MDRLLKVNPYWNQENSQSISSVLSPLGPEKMKNSATLKLHWVFLRKNIRFFRRWTLPTEHKKGQVFIDWWEKEVNGHVRFSFDIGQATGLLFYWISLTPIWQLMYLSKKVFYTRSNLKASYAQTKNKFWLFCTVIMTDFSLYSARPKKFDDIPTFKRSIKRFLLKNL